MAQSIVDLDLLTLHNCPVLFGVLNLRVYSNDLADDWEVLKERLPEHTIQKVYDEIVIRAENLYRGGMSLQRIAKLAISLSKLFVRFDFR